MNSDLVERVAILLWERMAGMEYTVHGWESMSAEFKEEWREHARAVVEAVVGDLLLADLRRHFGVSEVEEGDDVLDWLQETQSQWRRDFIGEFDPAAVSPEGQAPDPVLWERARLAQQAEYDVATITPLGAEVIA